MACGCFVARAARGRFAGLADLCDRESRGLSLRHIEHLTLGLNGLASAGRLAMFRPRAVAGPLSGTRPARHPLPATCRCASATGPCFPCRGGRSWFGRVSVSRPIEGLDSRMPAALCERYGHMRARGREASAKASARSAVRALRRTPQRSDGAGAVEALDGPRHANPSIQRAAAATGWAGCACEGDSTRRGQWVTCWPGAGEWPKGTRGLNIASRPADARPFRPSVRCSM